MGVSMPLMVTSWVCCTTIKTTLSLDISATMEH